MKVVEVIITSLKFRDWKNNMLSIKSFVLWLLLLFLVLEVLPKEKRKIKALSSSCSMFILKSDLFNLFDYKNTANDIYEFNCIDILILKLMHWSSCLWSWHIGVQLWKVSHFLPSVPFGSCKESLNINYRWKASTTP